MSDTSSSPNGTAQESCAQIPVTVLCFQRNMRLLRSSLLTGDLPAARHAFEALRALSPAAPALTTPMPEETKRSGSHAFVALHLALQAGNLEHARKAFLSLLGALRCPPPHRPRAIARTAHRDDQLTAMQTAATTRCALRW